MAIKKLKVQKKGCINPLTKKIGYSARVKTNGTADYDDIVADACRNTSLHKAEAKACFEMCMESVAEKLKQGYIVNLGPVGKLYPSCNSGWVETAEELTLSDITPKLYYRPADDVAAAIKGAPLQWIKISDTETDDDVEDGDEEEDGPGGEQIGD